MKTLRYTGSPKLCLAFLALLTATTLLMPSGAQAAERNGTVLFFSFADIQHVLARPSLPALTSLLSFSQPAFSWRAQSETAERAAHWNGILATATGFGLRGIAPGASSLVGILRSSKDCSQKRSGRYGIV